MKNVVKCPDCECEFEAVFNIMKWQLNETKRILSKTDEEIKGDWDNFLKRIENEKSC